MESSSWRSGGKGKDMTALDDVAGFVGEEGEVNTTSRQYVPRL